MRPADRRRPVQHGDPATTVGYAHGPDRSRSGAHRRVDAAGNAGVCEQLVVVPFGSAAHRHRRLQLQQRAARQWCTGADAAGGLARHDEAQSFTVPWASPTSMCHPGAPKGHDCESGPAPSPQPPRILECETPGAKTSKSIVPRTARCDTPWSCRKPCYEAPATASPMRRSRARPWRRSGRGRTAARCPRRPAGAGRTGRRRYRNAPSRRAGRAR